METLNSNDTSLHFYASYFRTENALFSLFRLAVRNSLKNEQTIKRIMQLNCWPRFQHFS